MVERDQTTPQITSFELDISLDQIPDLPCPWCDSPREKIWLTIKHEYESEGKPMIAQCDNVPGRRCTNCDVVTGDADGAILLLRETLTIVKQAGDNKATKLLEASLSAANQSKAMWLTEQSGLTT